MSAAENSLAAIDVPTDDTDIAHALTTLDQRIQAWREAIRQFHQVLQQQSRSIPDAADEPADQPTEQSEPEAAIAPTPPADEPPPAGAPVKVTRAMLEPGGNADDATESSGASPKDAQRGKGIKARLRRMVTADDDSGAPTDDTDGQDNANQQDGAGDGGASRADRRDEDEELLASLSTDVANTIRIKRRLCQGRKSVRELLDEMS